MIFREIWKSKQLVILLLRNPWNFRCLFVKYRRAIKGSRMGHSVKVSLWCVTLLINIKCSQVKSHKSSLLSGSLGDVYLLYFWHNDNSMCAFSVQLRINLISRTKVNTHTCFPFLLRKQRSCQFYFKVQSGCCQFPWSCDFQRQRSICYSWAHFKLNYTKTMFNCSLIIKNVLMKHNNTIISI